MELAPVPADVAIRALETAGEFRAVQRGPRSLQQILADAAAEMDAEDLYLAWLHGAAIPRLRHPRKVFRRLLKRG
jgi:hypothetical protein